MRTNVRRRGSRTPLSPHVVSPGSPYAIHRVGRSRAIRRGPPHGRRFPVVGHMPMNSTRRLAMKTEYESDDRPATSDDEETTAEARRHENAPARSVSALNGGRWHR